MEGLLMRRTALAAFVLAASLGAGAARADFQIMLREGATIVVESYRVEGGKLIGYRPSGTVEVAFSRVVNVKDLGSAQQPEAAHAPQAPREMPAAAHDPASDRQRELDRAIIIAYRDLATAQYRGDSKESIERRKAEIARLEAQRSGSRERSADPVKDARQAR
jgi:hypothetical protein